ncbi:MAG: type II toxin-antitoxin system HicA family toxin [Ignavibacteriae bacterium]|nr:MAG: type II toxin-antitoxin system HicA family toxin [Ignavibacteriota bacterium]
MTKLPNVSGKDLIVILKKIGFEIIRIKGSHHLLKHSDGRTTVVPVHSNESIGVGLLNKILKDCELTKEEFIKIK